MNAYLFATVYSVENMKKVVDYIILCFITFIHLFIHSELQ